MKKKLGKEVIEEFKKKIDLRGKIQLIHFESFTKQYKLNLSDAIEKTSYKDEDDIIKIYEKNIEDNKYFNVIFFKFDNKEDSVNFLVKFIENADNNCIAKNNSDYPFFIFFKNQNFNKEILYSHYLDTSQKIKIDSFYDLKSHNIFFIKNTKDDIERLLERDITNYYYEYDFKSESNEINNYKIEMLFMGQTGCGKSTFINYLLGKLRAFSTSNNQFKSKGGTYTHTTYPISIKDSEGFEVNSQEQQNKIFELLNNNIEEELTNRTHIAFYLIPGPFNSNRDLDYSCISSLIKLEEFNIHYYLIMTKDPNESEHFSKTSLRFLKSIIRKNDFDKINVEMDNEKLKEILQKIEEKLKDRIFSVDVSKRESTTIGKLLNQIYSDLKVEKENNIEFIKDIQKNRDKGSNYKIDFSGSEVIDNDKFIIPPKLENSPFFNLKKFKNDNNRKDRAKRVIKDAQDVSSIRKIFFCYNSKIKDNRKKMLKQILSIYECKNLTIDLLEGQLSSKERDEWFYQHDCTEALGNKIISICQEEYQKRNIVDNYIEFCQGFIRSIDEFGQYINEFINFEMNKRKIPYDCELKTN